MFLNKGQGNGNQVLKPETVELMSRNAMGNLKVTMLKTAMPNLTNDAEFFPGMPKNWGLGFMINEETTLPAARPAASHGRAWPIPISGSTRPRASAGVHDASPAVR